MDKEKQKKIHDLVDQIIDLIEDEHFIPVQEITNKISLDLLSKLNLYHDRKENF